MVAMVFTALAVAAVAQQQPSCGPIGSYLFQPSYCEDFLLRCPLRPYEIQPGDIAFAADGSIFWLVTHNMAGTSNPTHSMIAFRRPDGSMAILEAGPHDTMRVRTLDAVPHLRSYEVEGRVWVRRRAVPLTQEESDRLTAFALAQDGKRFAIARLGGQLTPLRSRGPIRTCFMGKPRDHNNFFCSELVMQSLAEACLVDPETARPSATYPRDIFMDRSPNPYLNKHLKLAPHWDPPARWTSNPEACQAGGQ